jgi:hypothetical protein
VATRVGLGIILAGAALSACSSSSPAGPYPPPGPQAVQVAYCNDQKPAWVAFQDGDGPWTHSLPNVAGPNTIFEHEFQSDRGAIATLTLAGGGLTQLSVLYGSPTELATAGATRTLFCGEPVSKTLLGTVAGLDTNEAAVVSGGFFSHIQTNPAIGGSFALKTLPSGPHDLVAARTTRTNGQAALSSVILRRDVDLPDSATLPVLDFTSPEAFAPATATLTIGDLGAESAMAGVRLITATSEVLLAPPPSASFAVTRVYAALPATQLRAADLQALNVSAVSASGSRSTQLYFRSIGDRFLSLPAPLTRPTFDTMATTPSLRLRARFVPQTDYDRAALITYQQGRTTIVSVTMTAAYAARTASGYDLIVPDLTGTAGFDPRWAVQPGRTVLWTAGRIGGTLDLGQDARAHDGSTQRSAFATDSIPGS